MGQCVTKCKKKPSPTLGSRHGDRYHSSSRSYGRRRAGHRAEQVLLYFTPSGEIVVYDARRADRAVAEACRLPMSSRDAWGKPKADAEQAPLPRSEVLFRRYRDRWEDAILVGGMERFCRDLGVDPMDFRVLLLAWKFRAANMFQFTRKEFLDGCKAIRADSIDGIRAQFPSLLAEAKQEERFKDLYRFTFQFGLDPQHEQRALRRETAIALWKLVFTQNPPPILEPWLNFLAENPSGIRGISWDPWNMFLCFVEEIDPDLSNYDADDAWPCIFDSFVEWEAERRRREAGGRGARGAGLRARVQMSCTEDLPAPLQPSEDLDLSGNS
ncbi:DCN1-like protein 3 [Arvicola amphibius]|uniref:DCN1-like protein 3 n=1 Tax=Arvicola amphibius TaxID=1047088 RepID=UPI0018E306FE|nr:DCN1-like protein 3 [Arvicola amphibius]